MKKSNTILVVEDDLIVAQDLQGLLEKLGYAVPHTSKNAEEARQRLGEQPIDLVLLDISLPGKQNGIDLAHYLNGLEIPFVFLTAHSDQKTLELAKATKPHGYIVKPFNDADIRSNVEIALYRHTNEQLGKKLALERAGKEKALAQLRLRFVEAERVLLADLSSDIATVREAPDLWPVLSEKLPPVFGYQAAAIAVKRPGLPYQYQIRWPGTTAEAAFQFPRLERVWEAENGNQRVQSGQSVRVLRLDEGGKLVPADVPDARLATTGGIEWMGSFLRNKGEAFGFLWFGYPPGSLPGEKIALFQAVSDQLSVAVSNVLANEEIARRETEKTQLLEISKALATVREKRALATLLERGVPPLLGADRKLWLFVLDPDGLYHSDWIMGQASPELRGQRLPEKFIHASTLVAHVMKQPGTQLFCWPDLLQQGYAHPHLPVIMEAGLAYGMAAPLRYEERMLGMFSLHSAQADQFSDRQFPLFEAICSMIAVKVANLLATDELVQQRELRELQLASNNAFMTLKDTRAIFSTIAGAVNRVIPLDTFGVWQKEAGEEIIQLQYFLKEGNRFKQIDHQPVPPAAATATELFRRWRSQQLNVPNEPLINTGDAYLDHCQRNPTAQWAHDVFGIRSSISIPVRLRNSTPRMLLLGSKSPYAFVKRDLEIMLAICPQITLALENRLAFEQVSSLQAGLRQENAYLQEEIRYSANPDEVVGTSQSLQRVLQQIQQVAPTDATVLIGGETGTGKELVARAIHHASPRREKILVKVNCATLPPELIESELFGHEKGSFTGAHERRIGKFELANGGTIFLDEIGEMPLSLQVKLLRVLQEREMERLGGNTPIKLNLRILAATNKNLSEEVLAGRFRPDLFYRLHVFPIVVPPLRERKEDIALLAMHFAGKMGKKMGKIVRGFTPDTLREMMAYPWYGNVRELEHVVEHSIIVATSELLTLGRPLRAEVLPLVGHPAENRPVQTLAEHEKAYILAVLRQTEGRVRGIGGAAELLAIAPTTLESRMERLGIRRERGFKASSPG